MMAIDYLVNQLLPGKLKPSDVHKISQQPAYTTSQYAATNKGVIPLDPALYGAVKAPPPPYRSNELQRPAADSMTAKEVIYRLMYL